MSRVFHYHSATASTTMRRYGPVKDAVHLLLCDVKNNIALAWQRERELGTSKRRTTTLTTLTQHNLPGNGLKVNETSEREIKLSSFRMHAWETNPSYTLKQKHVLPHKTLPRGSFALGTNSRTTRYGCFYYIYLGRSELNGNRHKPQRSILPGGSFPVKSYTAYSKGYVHVDCLGTSPKYLPKSAEEIAIMIT